MAQAKQSSIFNPLEISLDEVMHVGISVESRCGAVAATITSRWMLIEQDVAQ